MFSGVRSRLCGSAEEQTWEDNVDVSEFYDSNLALDWGSNVPGSGAPEKIMVAAVQALENRGYLVSQEGYRLLEEGLKASEEGDFVTLHQCSAKLRRELGQAVRDTDSHTGSTRCMILLRSTRQQLTFPGGRKWIRTAGLSGNSFAAHGFPR